MSRAIFESLRRITPSVASGADGLPRVVPESVDELAHVVGLAATEGWRVRVEGRGTWCPPDAPADLAVTTAGLDRLQSVAPLDLVARAEAGVTAAGLARALAGHGAWWALDPPGSPDRTLGSVLATATAGPLRHGTGPVRDHVLGLTLVTGDGRVVRAGGQVVKNVAGYDLTRLAIGSFGAFGIIAEANLRLRAAPAARLTLAARHGLDPLIDAGIAIRASGAVTASLELVSPALAGESQWLLLASLTGTADSVAAAARHVLDAAPAAGWQTLDPVQGARLDRAIASGAVAEPVSLRLGALTDGVPDVLDLLERSLDLGRVSVGLGVGGVRWIGQATAAAITGLRTALAEREIPLTLERAPWPIRRAVGHFGVYREGVGPLTARIRQVFDPTSVLVAPLEGASHG